MSEKLNHEHACSSPSNNTPHTSPLYSATPIPHKTPTTSSSSITDMPEPTKPQPPPPERAGYRGFGSFHSDDVEVLIRQDDAVYCPPALPFDDPAESPTVAAAAAASSSSSTSSNSHDRNVQWGAAARSHFLIDFQTWTFINHGAFGGVSRWVRSKAWVESACHSRRALNEGKMTAPPVCPVCWLQGSI